MDIFGNGHAESGVALLQVSHHEKQQTMQPTKMQDMIECCLL